MHLQLDHHIHNRFLPQNNSLCCNQDPKYLSSPVFPNSQWPWSQWPYPAFSQSTSCCLAIIPCLLSKWRSCKPSMCCLVNSIKNFTTHHCLLVSHPKPIIYYPTCYHTNPAPILTLSWPQPHPQNESCSNPPKNAASLLAFLHSCTH